MISGEGEQAQSPTPSLPSSGNSPAAVAPKSSPSAGSRHSLYSKLVEDDADMIGHVAYALYKRDKLKFCESVIANETRPASAGELATFVHSASLSTRIAAYRAEAELLLESFSEEVLEGTIQDIRAETDRELVQRLSQAKSWWRAAGENLVGNLLTIAVSALFLFILYGLRLGFLALVADSLGYEPKQAEQTRSSVPQSSTRVETARAKQSGQQGSGVPQNFPPAQ